MALLRFEHLSFSYPLADTRALDDVSLEIHKGEYVVLCGPSGCGKTTLLRHAKPGLLPVGARAGETFYKDAPLSQLPELTAAAEIGFVQQNPDNQIVTDFVWHELAFGLENMALPVPVIRRRLERLLPITAEDSAPETAKAEKEAKRPAVLEGKELWFRYTEKGKDILRGTDVTLHQGELLCLLGGNGAGKTTLMQALAGFRKPYRGKVKLAKGQRLCMLPQNARSLFVADTVEKELLDSAGQDQAKAMQMAEKLELTPLLARHPYDLSGGEIQRLAVGKLLLREEPTKGLDAYAKAELAQLLLTLCREGTSILIVTHDVEFAARYATGCALMFDGLLLSEGEPHAFFAGNRFYTTDANRIAAEHFPMDITCEEVIASCRSSLSAKEPEPPRG